MSDENRRYSQFNEDKIIDDIFHAVGTTNKFYVEIGCHEDGIISNTLALKDKGWVGYWFDAIVAKDVFEQFFTAENINEVLEKYTPKEFDFLSLDIDGNDYWVWKAMQRKPRVVCIEYNIKRPEGVQSYKADYMYAYQKDFGSSKEKMLELAKEKGYTLMAETEANLIFILDELVPLWEKYGKK